MVSSTTAASVNPFAAVMAPKPAIASMNPFANISYVKPSNEGNAAKTGFEEKRMSIDPSPAFKPLPISTSTPSFTPMTTSSSSSSSSSEVKTREEAKDKMRKLNRTFLNWLQKQNTLHPVAVWKDGVQDYIRYASSLSDAMNAAEEKDNDQKKAASVETVNPKPAPSTGGTLGSMSTAPAEKNPFPFPAAGAASKSSALSFGGSSSTAEKNVPSVGTIPPLMFTGFGKTAAPPSAFSSSSTETSTLPKPAASSAFSSSSLMSNPFSSFGAAPAPLTQASSGANENDGEEGGDDEAEPILEPEKVERNPDDKDEVLHEVACKLFRFAKETNEWKDVGKGSLKVTRDPDTKKTRMLVRNAMGKVSLNVAFYKGMSFTKTGAAGIRFAAVYGNEDNKLQSLLMKLKPADVAATLALLENQVSSLTA